MQENTKNTEERFLEHQDKLQQYYKINLSQQKWIFFVGIGIIFAGVVIIILSLVFYYCDHVNETNIWVLLIGVVSGLLVDFIGYIYVRMYIGTIEAATEFHKRLIYTNNNLFADLLISRIGDENAKNDALAKVADKIASGGA